MKPASLTPDYSAFLTEVRDRIQSARLQAGRAVNRELVMLHWDIGREIVEKQRTAGWGEAVVERLAADLRAELPDTRGFSTRTLRDTKRFYLAYSDDTIWPQAVAKLRISGVSAELKEIWPQAVAKLRSGFYLNLLNEKERDPDDRPSIGIILCAEKDDVEVEFALKTKANPIGVAEYQLQEKLPAEFKGKLPTAKQLADAAREVLPAPKAPARKKKS